MAADIKKVKSDKSLIHMHNTNLKKTITSNQDYLKKHNLVSLIPNLLFVIDRKGYFHFFKANNEEELIIPPDQIIGKNISDLPFTKNDARKILLNISKSIKTGKIIDFSYSFNLPDIGRKHYDARMTSINKNEVLVIVTDITEKHEIGSAWRESEQKFRTLFESSNDGIFILKNDKFIDCNLKAQELFDRTEEELLEHSPYEFSPKLQPDGQNSKNKAIYYIKKAIKGYPQRFKWAHTRSNGKEFISEISLNVFSFNEEKYVQATVRDISDQIKFESRIKEKETKLKQLNEELTSQNEEYKSLNEEYIAVNEELNNTHGTLQNAYRELKKREDLYKNLNESSPIGILLFDTKGNILEANTAIIRILGSPSFEATKSINVLKFKPLIDSGFSEDFTNCLISGHNVSNQKYYITNWDKKIFVNYSFTPICDEMNNIIAVLSNVQDITSQKEAELSLIESEKKYRLIADNHTDLVWTRNLDLELTYISPSVYRTFGYTPDEYKLLPMKRIYHEESYNYIMSLFNSEMTKYYNDILDIDDYCQIIEAQVIKKDRSLIWVELNVSLTLDENKKLIGLHGVTREISKRKKAEQSLRESEEKFRFAFQTSPDAINISLLETGKSVDFNEGFENISGWKKEEVIGKDTSEIKIWKNPEDRIRFTDLLKKNGSVENMEAEFRRKDGKIITGIISAGLINLNNTPHIIAITKDISDRKQTEIELLKAKDRAVESDKLKTTFLSNMSHEIRTPMNSIVGFANLLTKPDLTVHKKELYIKQINRSSDLLLHLIDEIIDLSKIEANQLHIENEICCLKDVFNELYTYFNEELKIKNSPDLQFKMNLPENKELYCINTDKYRLKQILSNLLNNAFKFTQSGEISFGFNLYDPDNMMFYVKDSGIGVPPEKINLIFERFVQANFDESRRIGTGLGLTISKKIIELMGGRIWVESDINKGSVFYFVMPYKSVSSIDDITKNKVFINNNINWKNHTILIAEDDNMNYMFLEEMFFESMVNLIRAKTGEEAIEQVLKNPKIDLVLMDIQMPGMNGYEATEKIKSINPDIPIIAQTAFAMSVEKEKSLKSGCSDYITKPIMPDVLINTLKKYLKE
ncbi:MAG: PAS domain S-box protein [Bacteroidota bacterium]